MIADAIAASMRSAIRRVFMLIAQHAACTSVIYNVSKVIVVFNLIRLCSLPYKLGSLASLIPTNSCQRRARLR